MDDSYQKFLSDAAKPFHDMVVTPREEGAERIATGVIAFGLLIAFAPEAIALTSGYAYLVATAQTLTYTGQLVYSIGNIFVGSVEAVSGENQTNVYRAIETVKDAYDLSPLDSLSPSSDTLAGFRSKITDYGLGLSYDFLEQIDKVSAPDLEDSTNPLTDDDGQQPFLYPFPDVEPDDSDV